MLPHEPVLYQEILDALLPNSDGRYVDGTIGAAGHALGILEASNPKGELLGLDVDPLALELARERLTPFLNRVHLVQASFTRIEEMVNNLGWASVNGIVLDFGASSMQFDSPQRGFSFQSDGPLDMRFDPLNPVKASSLVNTLTEAELGDVIRIYGEERWAKRIARAIVQSRPLTTTRQLSDVIVNSAGRFYKDSRIHPATRTFQALRIVVNQELQAIEKVLPQAVRILAPKGRLATISFHSLEDRLVKNFFRQESRDCLCPPGLPVCTCGHSAVIFEVNRKPIQPSDSEIARNPRSRSARLRVIEKLDGT